MDREKVKKGLECCQLVYESKPYEKCPYSNGYECGDCDINQLHYDALAMLKEQEEPKQIVRKQCKKEHDDGSIDYFAEWYCPHCNSLLKRGFGATWIEYCFKCGKPITWEGCEGNG